MKLSIARSLIACIIVCNASAATAAAPLPVPPAQKEASLWVARVLDRYRYKAPGAQDAPVEHPFDRFIEALDPARLVFAESDLTAMAGFRQQLDKLTGERQMEVPNTIFAMYLARSTELHAYALDILQQPLDFNGGERYQRARATSRREKDATALRDLWRRRVMDDYLNLRLSGSTEPHIRATLQRRYERSLKRVQSMMPGDLANLFLNAYVQSYDPHGTYYGPVQTTADIRQDDLAGVGVVLRSVGDLVTVQAVVAGSSAQLSDSIHRGDAIVGVAEASGLPMTDVVGWSVEEVVRLLRGIPGSAVTVDILPQGTPLGSAPQRVRLPRAEVFMDSKPVKGQIESIQRGAASYRIGVVAVPSYYSEKELQLHPKDQVNMTRQVASVLAQMKEQKIDAILLDLSDNDGAPLAEAIGLTGLFLPGAAVVRQVEADRKVKVERTPQDTAAWGGPLTILIGRRSAAATEVIAAALQDHGRALVIGDVSQGRGSVQVAIDLNRFSSGRASELGMLKMTVAMLCRVNGMPIQPAGVTPDIVVPGRLATTPAANGNLYGPLACPADDIPTRTGLNALLPALGRLHDNRMQINLPYQAQLARRAHEEKGLANDEAVLNEVERRRTAYKRPEGNIARLQLAEAVQVLADAVHMMRGTPAPTEGKR